MNFTYFCVKNIFLYLFSFFVNHSKIKNILSFLGYTKINIKSYWPEEHSFPTFTLLPFIKPKEYFASTSLTHRLCLLLTLKKCHFFPIDVSLPTPYCRALCSLYFLLQSQLISPQFYLKVQNSLLKS